MGTINAFPIETKKGSGILSVLTLPSNSKIFVMDGTTFAVISLANFRTMLDYQLHSAVLDQYAQYPPTDLGANLLLQEAPGGTSYLLSTILGVPIFRTSTEVVADLLANGNGVDRTTTQRLFGKTINGLLVAAATAASDDGITTDDQGVQDVFPLTVVKVGGWTGGFFKIRLTGSTDVRMPRAGLLATVTGQPLPDSDDIKASATVLDLTDVKGGQVDITGTTQIETILLAEGSEKVLRFTGILTLLHSATLVCSTGRSIVTEANGVATIVGGSGGVVKVKDYQTADKGKTTLDGDVRLMGDVYAAGPITLMGALVTGGPVSFIGSAASVIRALAASDVTLPVTGTLASGIDNFSTLIQTPAAATRTYLAGSNLVMPAAKMKVGTKFTWKFNITKTAAGSAASTIDVCVGTAGTTADAAILSFTKPAGTAAADEGFVLIEVVAKNVEAGTATLIGEMIVYHNLASTGHMTIPVACVHINSAGTDDFALANLIAGVCITTGAADAITISQVSSHAAYV